MRILLLGKDGQVGWELQRSLSPLGSVLALGRAQCDLSDLGKLKQVLDEYKPQLIVNAAAYTAVDKAETEVELARTLNSEVPALLAAAAKTANAWLVHYSTDYVFDGTKDGVYAEDDTPSPLSVYGQTKLEGEQHIVQSGCKHVILRTSWVFSAHGANFAKTMLRLAAERSELKVIDDQYGAPTSAELIADVTALCIARLTQSDDAALQGIYHLTAAGVTTWHGYAQYVIAQAMHSGQTLKCLPSAVLAISSSEYSLPAKRPHNSRLATDKLQAAFGLELPPWTYHVQRMLDELTMSAAAK